MPISILLHQASYKLYRFAVKLVFGEYYFRKKKGIKEDKSATDVVSFKNNTLVNRTAKVNTTTATTTTTKTKTTTTTEGSHKDQETKEVAPMKIVIPSK